MATAFSLRKTEGTHMDELSSQRLIHRNTLNRRIGIVAVAAFRSLPEFATRQRPSFSKFRDAIKLSFDDRKLLLLIDVKTIHRPHE